MDGSWNKRKTATTRVFILGEVVRYDVLVLYIRRRLTSSLSLYKIKSMSFLSRWWPPRLARLPQSATLTCFPSFSLSHAPLAPQIPGGLIDLIRQKQQTWVRKRPSGDHPTPPSCHLFNAVVVGGCGNNIPVGLSVGSIGLKRVCGLPMGVELTGDWE